MTKSTTHSKNYPWGKTVRPSMMPSSTKVPLPITTAKILKSIKHENIITCYRMFKTSSKLYIVYGYEEGNTLDEVLELGPKALTFPQSNPPTMARIEHRQAVMSGPFGVAKKLGSAPQREALERFFEQKIERDPKRIHVFDGSAGRRRAGHQA